MNFLCCVLTRFSDRLILCLMAAVLLGSASNALALNLASYMPHEPGNQWSYVNNNQATLTTTIGSPVMLPSGVVAIPWTRVNSSEPGIAVTYSTIDSSGFRRYKEYVSSVYIAGYGNTSAFGVYTPALSLFPADVTVGSTYRSTSTVSLTYTNVTTAILDCSVTMQVVGFETVWNNAGTQSWSALKMISSITMSGTVNGQFISVTSASTVWMVDGLGAVMMYSPNQSLVMETWKLTSTNISARAPSSITIPPTDDDGNYTVSWAASATPGVTYSLKEATDSAFTTEVRIAYSGTGTSASISGRITGKTYYYAVSATKSGWTDSAWTTGGNGCVVAFPGVARGKFMPGVMMLLLHKPQ